MKHNHYARLIAMSVVSFLSMYVLMYAMVNSLSNVYNNVNQFYMAGLMAAPMVIIELLLMSSMYQNKRLNMLIIAGAVLIGGAFFAFIRWQAVVGDRQFLRSMIPHHSGAILMCEQSAIRNPKVVELCKEIVRSQQSEIDQMKGILQEMNDAR